MGSERPPRERRSDSSQRTASAEEFYRSAKEELAKAERDWRAALKSVGLPDETTAAEVEKLAGQYRALAEMRSRAEAKQEEIERFERDHFASKPVPDAAQFQPDVSTPNHD